MLIYKYMPTVKFFTNFKFRFTPAEDLNDPNELEPEIRFRDPDSYARGVINLNIGNAYHLLRLSNPNLTQAEAAERNVDAALQIEQNFDLPSMKQKIYEIYKRTINKNVGVLSLTYDPCSMPMWAHYAGNYKGLVIGLDADSEFFQPKPGEPRRCGQLMNVLYKETSPVVYVDPEKIDIPNEVFFTKAREWEHEKECRLIKYLLNASEVEYNKEGKKIHLFEVPPAAVKEVIFGSKIGPNEQEQVEHALRERAPHVLRKRITFVHGDGLRVLDC